MKSFIILVCIVVAILLVLIFIVLKKSKTKKSNIKSAQPPLYCKYEIKKKYLSDCETEFYDVIRNIVENKYILFPQVPLSQIIVKKSDARYRNELYRVIDFCIFSKDYTPLLCIEINDNTHHQKTRYLRDKKVKEILSNAGLPLITLWTEYGVNKDYIRKRINEHISM